MEDLGASSLDLVEITLESEREFGILLAGRPLFDAAILVFGPGTLEDDGELTDAGRRLVVKRFPHLSEEDAEDLIDVTDVQRQISRVSTWTETIAALTSAIPERCRQAGGEVSTAADGIPVCEGAGAGYEKPSLEDWNEDWLKKLYAEENPA